MQFKRYVVAKFNDDTNLPPGSFNSSQLEDWLDSDDPPLDDGLEFVPLLTGIISETMRGRRR